MKRKEKEIKIKVKVEVQKQLRRIVTDLASAEIRMVKQPELIPLDGFLDYSTLVTDFFSIYNQSFKPGNVFPYSQVVMLLDRLQRFNEGVYKHSGTTGNHILEKMLSAHGMVNKLLEEVIIDDIHEIV